MTTERDAGPQPSRTPAQDKAAGNPYADDVPVTFRHQREKRKGAITLWVRVSLIMAGLAGALIAVLALGPGIEFHEYWWLVAVGFGVLGVLLLWEMIAAALSRD